MGFRKEDSRPLLLTHGFNHGTVQFDIGTITASGGNASFAGSIAGLPADSTIMLQPAQAQSGIYCYSASVVSEGTINASFVSATGSAFAAASVTFHYIAFS